MRKPLLMEHLRIFAILASLALSSGMVAAATSQATAPPQQQAPPAAAQKPPTTPPASAPAAAPQTPAPAPAAPASGNARVSLHLENANMMQVLGIIADELKMNYIVDPAVAKGTVNINTMGDVRQEDLLPLLQAILQANGAAAVQSGSFWRIVPLKEVPRIPIGVTQDSTGASLPADDRMILNVVALRFVTAADMSKILGTYLSDAGQIVTHEAGNILLITDTSRNMKRLMDLINVFDTDALAKQRVRVIQVQNSRARDIAKDLQEIFSAYALSEKSAAVRFIPIERVNSILVVSSNPNVHKEVEQWVEKLDKPTRKTGLQNFVYKVENGSAENLASVLSRLYGGATGFITRPPTPGGIAGGLAASGPAAPSAPGQAAPSTPEAAPEVSAQAGAGLQSPVRIVPDLINNSLLIQATAQDYETIRQTLKELDIIPRQVMIEAKVYEVTLNGALSFGVETFLQQRSGAERRPLGQFTTSTPQATATTGTTGSVGTAAATVLQSFTNPGLSFSMGTLIGRSRELLGFLNAQENRTRVRVLSAPTILSSDNQEARIQVGEEIPILTSQGVSGGAQVAGSTLFANTVQQRDTGVILSVKPRINPSGLVTLGIQQEVSAPQAPVAGSIQSPSIQKRSVSTQVTVQDGETISLGGIISTSQTLSKSRIPLLGDIPGIGLLFGTTSYSTSRTELIVMLTPHVIQDTDDAQEATREFRDKLKQLRKMLREKSD